MNLTALAPASGTPKYDKKVTPQDVGAEPRQITLGPTHIVLRGLPDNREFWKVVNAVTFTSQRGAGRRAVYRAVAYYAALTDARTCYASVATMANRAGLGTSATREQLRALERNGDIEGIGNCRGAEQTSRLHADCPQSRSTVTVDKEGNKKRTYYYVHTTRARLLRDSRPVLVQSGRVALL